MEDAEEEKEGDKGGIEEEAAEQDQGFHLKPMHQGYLTVIISISGTKTPNVEIFMPEPAGVYENPSIGAHFIDFVGVWRGPGPRKP